MSKQRLSQVKLCRSPVLGSSRATCACCDSINGSRGCARRPSLTRSFQMFHIYRLKPFRCKRKHMTEVLIIPNTHSGRIPRRGQ